MIVIFYVDRFVKYSTNMFDKLKDIIDHQTGVEIYYIGPDDKNQARFSDQKVPDSVKLWSYGNFLRKISFYVLKHRPTITHYCFELETYGTSLIDVMKFPLLLFLTKISGSKIILSFHGIFVYKKDSKWQVHYYDSIKIPYFALKFFESVFMKLVCKLSNHIIVEADIGKSALVEHTEVPERKISVIQFGIANPSKVNKQKMEYFKQKTKNKKIILYFGVISPRKGQEKAIRAFSKIVNKIPNYVLVIAGTATNTFKEHEKFLHELTKQYNLESNIIFTGYVEDDEIDALFYLSEFVLYIYEQMSSSTFALTFAIQHSKPAIVSNTQTFTELLKFDEAVFVNPDNEIDLCNAMLNLAENEEIRSKLENNIKKVCSRLTWEKSAEKHYAIYKDLMNNIRLKGRIEK